MIVALLVAGSVLASGQEAPMLAERVAAGSCRRWTSGCRTTRWC